LQSWLCLIMVLEMSVVSEMPFFISVSKSKMYSFLLRTLIQFFFFFTLFFFFWSIEVM
jgi:hypothetical protein